MIETSAPAEITDKRRTRGRWPVWLLGYCVVLSAIASIPYFFIANPHPGESRWSLHMPATHDMHAHYNQMRSFEEGLRSGTVYPRWEADTNRGFGAPTTSYYPPGVYYLTALGYALTSDWTAALLIAQGLMMLGSGLALYWYARQRLSRAAAAVAMSAYVLGPYHLLDQYQRGAIAELLGFVWMPLLLGAGERLLAVQGSERLRWSERLKWMLVVGVSYGGFIWSHPPTAYQFSLGYVVVMVVLATMKRQWRGLVWVASGLGLGMALAAAYILPAILEQSFVNSDNVAQDYPYHDSYVLVRLGLNAGRANYFLDLIDRIWILGAIFLVAAAVALLVIRPRVLRRWSPLKEGVILWLTLGGTALFMMTRLSYPFGRYIPKIEIGIFTWRMLGIVTLAVALLAGACGEVVLRMAKTWRRHEAGLAFAVAVWIIIGSAWFSLEEVIKPYSNGNPFVPEPEPFNFALMPRTGYGDIFRLPRVEPAELERGNGSATVERWMPEHRAVRVELRGSDRLLLRAFNFPGWTATVDGRRASLDSSQALRVRTASGDEAVVRKLDSPGWSPSVDGQPAQVIEEVSLGDIAVPLEAGTHEVRLDYRPTPVRRAAGLITLAALALLGAGIVAMITLQRTRQGR
jgi:hypothetical protein